MSTAVHVFLRKTQRTRFEEVLQHLLSDASHSVRWAARILRHEQMSGPPPKPRLWTFEMAGTRTSAGHFPSRSSATFCFSLQARRLFTLLPLVFLVCKGPRESFQVRDVINVSRVSFEAGIFLPSLHGLVCRFMGLLSPSDLLRIRTGDSCPYAAFFSYGAGFYPPERKNTDKSHVSVHMITVCTGRILWCTAYQLVHIRLIIMITMIRRRMMKGVPSSGFFPCRMSVPTRHPFHTLM